MVELWDVLDENGNMTGRVHERGKPMKRGEYHLVVHVWVMNSKNEFLISKRTPNKNPFPNMWECTGGSAVAGDDSMVTAIKEVNEELGVVLKPKNGQRLKRYVENFENGSGHFVDVWIFRQEVDLSEISFQPDETCDAMLADKAKIEDMIDAGIFLGRDIFFELDELFYFCDKPFWEIGYHDKTASTFSKGPTSDTADFHENLKPCSKILDVGCGEGRNSIFLAEQGHIVEGFDLSEAGIEKARSIAMGKGLEIGFFVCDLGDFAFGKEYDAILSHGVLHLPEKAVRDKFISEAQANTKSGGYNIIGVFTNRLPATPDNAPFTKSLFDVGELPAKYEGWKIISHDESTLRDSHPGGVSHEHAYERIIAQKI
ncbi:MAG: methyltransferase domain-containing protein [Oscillospiraceae bacterium]|nr:methyltransferase domain-containing protein [Oscillospiraceae bacterium]